MKAAWFERFGAGRVGHYAIQWARMAGARVIASASNARDEAVCHDAGAQQVFNHREAGWGERVKALNGGKPIDRVPLAEIARANELVEKGASTGCVVVDVTA